MRIRLVIAGWLLLISACARSPDFSGAEPPAASEPTAEPAALTPTEVSPRKLIRTVRLGLIVADGERAAAEARRIAAAAGGYVGESHSNRWSGQVHVRMTLRIPNAALDAALEELRALAERVDSEHQETSDVTDRYVDLEARIKTLELTEAELQSLLAESRAEGRKIDGIMAIYRELTEIRSKSEALQGQLNLLTSQVSYSTVHLSLDPDEAANPQTLDTWQPLVVVRDSWRTLIVVLRGLADFAIFAVIVLAPIFLLVGLVLWLIVRGWRKIRRRVRRPAE